MVKAVYHRNPAYPDNPLVEALPPPLITSELMDALRELPPPDPQARFLPARERMMFASKVMKVYIPLSTAPLIYSTIYNGLVSTYTSNTSVEAMRRTVALKEAHDTQQSAQMVSMQAASCSILGASGIGKTSSIQRILRLIPQVIEHDEYNGQKILSTQITHISIQCPCDCSIKGACISILAEIDKLLATSYADDVALKRNTTTDSLVVRISILCFTYHIGLIVIDEIQNVLSGSVKGGNNQKLLRFLVQLMNDTGVSVLLVGTPEVSTFFDSNQHLSRRTRGPRLAPLPYDDEFKALAAALWEQQATRDYVPVDELTMRLLYEISDGVPAQLCQLLSFAQQYAISSGKETLTGDVLRRTAKEYDLRKPTETKAQRRARLAVESKTERRAELAAAEKDESTTEDVLNLIAAAEIKAPSIPDSEPADALSARGRPKAYRDDDDLLVMFERSGSVSSVMSSLDSYHSLMILPIPC